MVKLQGFVIFTLQPVCYKSHQWKKKQESANRVSPCANAKDRGALHLKLKCVTGSHKCYVDFKAILLMVFILGMANYIDAGYLVPVPWVDILYHLFSLIMPCMLETMDSVVYHLSGVTK